MELSMEHMMEHTPQIYAVPPVEAQPGFLGKEFVTMMQALPDHLAFELFQWANKPVGSKKLLVYEHQLICIMQ